MVDHSGSQNIVAVFPADVRDHTGVKFHSDKLKIVELVIIICHRLVKILSLTSRVDFGIEIS